MHREVIAVSAELALLPDVDPRAAGDARWSVVRFSTGAITDDEQDLADAT